MSLTVGSLIPAQHSGRRADVAGRTGRLLWSTIPVYCRIETWCWYLIVPSRHKMFAEDAVSLQWASSEPVTLLESTA